MGRLLLTIFLILNLGNMYAQQDAIYGKKMVKKLAAKRMNGRGYYRKADAKAAKYIAQQMQDWYVSPFSNNSYKQSYQFSVNYFPDKMKVAIDGKNLQPGLDFLIGATSNSAKGKYNIVEGKRHDLLDTADMFSLIRKAKGNFLYFNNEKDSTESKEVADIINQNLEYLQYSPDVDVKGIILYSSQKLTWTVLPYQGNKTIIELHKKINPPTTIQLNVTAKFDSAYTTQNLAGYIRGTQKPDSFIVISAHYDHLGRMGKRTLFPGANDNASGTGFVLSLMRHYALHPPKYTMVFLFFSGEEIGLKGSEYFTQNPLFNLKKIKFLWNFDMAGTGKTGIQVVNSTIFTQQFAILDSINKSKHLLADIKVRGSAANSDHYWFYKKGVPCFFSYTLGGVNYHDINDTYKSLPFDAWGNYQLLVERFFDAL